MECSRPALRQVAPRRAISATTTLQHNTQPAKPYQFHAAMQLHQQSSIRLCCAGASTLPCVTWAGSWRRWKAHCMATTALTWCWRSCLTCDVAGATCSWQCSPRARCALLYDSGVDSLACLYVDVAGPCGQLLRAGRRRNNCGMHHCVLRRQRTTLRAQKRAGRRARRRCSCQLTEAA